MTILTINPSTGNVIKRYTVHSNEEISDIIHKGHHSFLDWRSTGFDIRRSAMMRLAALLRKNQDVFAKLIACEMGKPISAGKAEIEKCAWVCEHYAEQAETYLATREIKTEMGKHFVCYQPLGVVFAIMPWNFPFWQVFRFAAPTIMAGNAALLKHASISTGAGHAIEQLFREAGFPQHLFQQVIIDNEAASMVISDPHIVAVTLTGSERAGRTVASYAGLHLKKCVLELGGNDPYIVLSDADLEFAAQMIVKSRLNNTGQVCIAAKRVIVIQDVESELISYIQKFMEQYTMGDPLDPEVKLGPLAREDLRTTLHQQVLDSISSGANLIVGGEIPNGPGFYYPPTLLTSVRPGMKAFDEELFGPVICVISALDVNDAVALANQSSYGLGSAIFTRDRAKGEHMAIHDIETGTCYVNAMVSSDPRIPFGGIKSSGFGRELSREGILEFVNIKSIGVGG